MIETILFAGAAVLLLLGLHPFMTYPLSLLVIKRLRPTAPSPATATAAEPDFTICMCAYNEEGVIEQKARNLLALKQRTPGLEILIYVDAATDRTAQILRSFEPELTVHVAQERRGKTHGMNLLAARAKGSILLFTDANVMLDSDCLEGLSRDFSDPQVGCVCGNLIYTNSVDSVTAATGSLYWRLEERIKALEQHTGSVMGADGSLFAIRRSLHRPPPDHIIDDMYVSFMTLIEGYRIIQSTRARAFEASASNSSEEFARKSRIACQAFNVHRLLWPQLRRLDRLTLYKYVSHKVLRWLSIYFLTLSGALLLAALIGGGRLHLAAGLVLATIVVVSLGWSLSLKPFSQIVDVLLSLAGAGLGVWKSLRGESYQTWTPAASVRKAPGGAQ